MSVLLFEFGFEVTVGQTVTFQLCDFLLQVTDLKKQVDCHYLGEMRNPTIMGYLLKLQLAWVLCL